MGWGAVGSTLYRLLGGRSGSMGASLRWRISERAVYAARAFWALAGAKGWLRVSMCQIASESWRAMSTWATFAPRCLPSGSGSDLLWRSEFACGEGCEGHDRERGGEAREGSSEGDRGGMSVL